MTQADFDPRVHIDWKTPGGEWLELLRDRYPGIGVFDGDGYERLLDELTHEMPEHCLQYMAPLLAAQGYDLWNLDAGADDYRPVIVPARQREAFVRYWQDGEHEWAMTPVRIEPQPFGATGAAGAARPAGVDGSGSRQRKRRRLDWLEEVHEYPGPTPIDGNAISNGWASVIEQDEDCWLCFLLDYNAWPPVEHDMLEQRSDGTDGADLQLLHADAQASLWKRRVHSGPTSAQDLFEYERREGHDLVPFGPAHLRWPEFEYGTVVVDGQVFERQRLYQPDGLTRVWRITADSSDIIFEHPDDLTLLPLDDRRLLILQHHGLSCWVWRPGPPHALIAVRPLPVCGERLTESAAWLGGDEVLLFSEAERANLECPTYRESVLQAWRFNFTTGQAVRAVLDGLGSEQRHETRLLVTQPSQRITLRTFRGQLQVSRGHGDWWVWNYRTNTFGTRTLAWFWNQRTHQVVKLDSRDIPRIEPVIRYLAAQDRYLALETDFVARLPAFERMLEAKGVEVLVFE